MSLLLLFGGSSASTALEMLVEMDFGSGYEDVSDDVIAPEGVQIEYGIQGNGPLDRMASSGTCEFALRNDAGNSGGLVGYYSPNHVNCRAGFTFGIPVRIRFLFEASYRTKFVGKLYVIDPVPGQHRSRRVHCTAHDYMYELAETDLRTITPQIGKTETELIQEVLDALPVDVQPTATAFDTGLDVYPYAFDNIQGGVKAATALNHVLSSSWGRLVLTGDGTLTYLNRQNGLLQTAMAELDDDMTELVVPSSLTNTYDFVRVTTHPRTITATDTVVLCTLPTTETPEFAPSETKTFWLNYRNPDNEDLRAGGTDFQDPVTATTDYTANTLADGSGTNRTANFDVTATFFASTAKFEVTNNHASSAFLTKLQGRGRGIYDVTPVTQESTGSPGNRQISVDLPYQDDANIGKDLADFIRNEYQVLSKQVDEVTFFAGKTDEMTAHALDREPGDLILLSETMTGLSGAGALIQRVHLRVFPPLHLECAWGLAPKVAGDQWILGDADQSLLEDTTILSYA